MTNRDGRDGNTSDEKREWTGREKERKEEKG